MSSSTSTRSSSRAVRAQARQVQRDTGLPYAAARRSVTGPSDEPSAPQRVLITGRPGSGRTRKAVARIRTLASDATALVLCVRQPHRFADIGPMVLFDSLDDLLAAEVAQIDGAVIVIDRPGAVDLATLALPAGVNVIVTATSDYNVERDEARLVTAREQGWEVVSIEEVPVARVGPFYQHMRTDDPDVIAAVEMSLADRTAFGPLARALAEELGGVTPIAGQSMGQLRMSGISALERPNGKWSEMKHVAGLPLGMKAWRPHKNTPAEAKMDALVVRPARVPGLPDQFDADGGRQHYWLTPSVFVWDGYAYMSLSMSPQREQSVRGGMRWVECLASQVDDAHEAYAASVRNRDDGDGK